MKNSTKNFKTDLSIACSNDELRPVLQHIIFEDGYVVCTDAHILVKQKLSLHNFNPDEIEQMNGKAIHKDTFKEIFKYDMVIVQDGQFVCTKKNVVAKFELKVLEDKYPNYNAVFPENAKEVDEIGFDIKIMTKISKISLSDFGSMRISFYGKERAMLLRGAGLDSNEEKILLMPVLLT